MKNTELDKLESWITELQICKDNEHLDNYSISDFGKGMLQGYKNSLRLVKNLTIQRERSLIDNIAVYTIGGLSFGYAIFDVVRNMFF